MIFVVILCYNEADALRALLERLDAALKPAGEPYRLVVVDDGSSDGTAAVAQDAAARLPVHLLKHERNRGVPRAFDTGLRYVAAEGKGDDLAITIEGDGTNSPELTPAIARKLREGYDIVCASRSGPEGAYQGFPLSRLVMSRGVNALLRTAMRLPGVTEYTLFFRGYRVAALQKAIAVFGERFIECAGFESNTEILLKTVHAARARCGEVPTIYRYDLKRSKSRMRAARTIAAYFKLILDARIGWDHAG